MNAFNPTRQIPAFGLIAALFFVPVFVPAIAEEHPACLPFRQATDRPNFIFIMADDLGYGEIEPYGQRKIRTPNLAAMSQHGLTFTDFYSGSTVCAPARNSLLTGQHTGHTFVRGNYQEDLPIPSADVTVAEILKNRGYKTAIIGKWGLGGFASSGYPLNQGFDYFFGFLDQIHAHDHYPEWLWENRTKWYNSKAMYAQDLFQERALNFIRQNCKDPFFLYYPVTLPHASIQAPEEAIQGYLGQFPERPFAGDRYAAQPTPNAAVAAMISYLDEDVGELRELVEQLGIERNTVIFFTSDNGPTSVGGRDDTFFHATSQFRGRKGDLLEGGIRVPLIIEWPKRVMPGRRSDEVLAMWDITPTLSDLANSTPMTRVDGKSFKAILLGEKQKVRHDFLYWEYGNYHFQQAVRFRNWKGIRLGTERPVALYDLRDDPGETRDVSSAHPTVIEEIERIMEREHIGSLSGKFRVRTGQEAFYRFETWPAGVRSAIQKGYDFLMDLIDPG